MVRNGLLLLMLMLVLLRDPPRRRRAAMSCLADVVGVNAAPQHMAACPQILPDEDGESISSGYNSDGAAESADQSDSEDAPEEERGDGDWGPCPECCEWTEMHVTTCCSDVMCRNCMDSNRRCPEHARKERGIAATVDD
eukprot:gene6342-biopygen684